MIYKYLIQWYFGKNVASMILKFNNIEMIFFNVPKIKISIPSENFYNQRHLTSM